MLFVNQLIVLVVQQNCQVGCSQHNGLTLVGNGDITLLNNLGAVHELEGDILNLGDSSGLLSPCSDINSGCTHSLLQSRSPASEVIALTSNITLECRSLITAAQILVNLIGKDFRSFHAIGVGYGKVTRNRNFKCFGLTIPFIIRWNRNALTAKTAISNFRSRLVVIIEF